jgi:hypothetical protein
MILFCMFLQFFEKYNYYANKMKNKEIPHNGWNNYVERDNIDTANTQMHDRSRSWLGTVTGDTASTQMHDRSRSWLGTVAGDTANTQIHDAHAPGLAQWRAILLTHKYMTRSRSWLGTVAGDTANTQIHDHPRSWLGTVAGLS